MIIEKHVQSKILRDYFFVKGKINLDYKYFIEKIEEGIKLPNNQSFKTNIHGEMTSYQYFITDVNFIQTMFDILDYTETNKLFEEKVFCANAWGFKESFSGHTKEHNHHQSILSGIIYLSNIDQPLVFDEINEFVNPEVGNFAIFSSFLNHKTNKRINDQRTKYGISFNFDEVFDAPLQNN